MALRCYLGPDRPLAGQTRREPSSAGSHAYGVLGHHRGMVTRGELSSLASSLDDLSRRITRAAEEESTAGRDGTATELFGVERALQDALRRMRRLS